MSPAYMRTANLTDDSFGFLSTQKHNGVTYHNVRACTSTQAASAVRRLSSHNSIKQLTLTEIICADTGGSGSGTGGRVTSSVTLANGW